jgi:hypothetical protein
MKSRYVNKRLRFHSIVKAWSAQGTEALKSGLIIILRARIRSSYRAYGYNLDAVMNGEIQSLLMPYSLPKMRKRWRNRISIYSAGIAGMLIV